MTGPTHSAIEYDLKFKSACSRCEVMLPMLGKNRYIHSDGIICDAIDLRMRKDRELGLLPPKHRRRSYPPHLQNKRPPNH